MRAFRFPPLPGRPGFDARRAPPPLLTFGQIVAGLAMGPAILALICFAQMVMP